jgi:hypothetical protein
MVPQVIWTPASLRCLVPQSLLTLVLETEAPQALPKRAVELVLSSLVPLFDDSGLISNVRGVRSRDIPEHVDCLLIVVIEDRYLFQNFCSPPVDRTVAYVLFMAKLCVTVNLLVQLSVPRMPLRGFGSHPCRVVSISYRWPFHCHGKILLVAQVQEFWKPRGVTGPNSSLSERCWPRSSPGKSASIRPRPPAKADLPEEDFWTVWFSRFTFYCPSSPAVAF